MLPVIKIEDYNYPLPEERIAKFPLEKRDASKLLLNLGDGIREDKFINIANHLPKGALMIFNDTKVVPARLFFQRLSGAIIEIFCLEPNAPSDYQVNFASTESCCWKCIVGNVKKWKGDVLGYLTDDEELKAINLRAELVERIDNTCIVRFVWDGGQSFSKVMEMCGRIPIPPYLNRDTQALDYERYQTTYARFEGSVAAPTAGLHFTDAELEKISARGIDRETVCLHVGAGTFLPVKSEYISDHIMHSEPFSVKLEVLEKILAYLDDDIISVGTTSTRTLESLYYLGVHCIERGEPGYVIQWEPYRDEGYEYSAEESISALVRYLRDNNLTSITSRTSLIIAPSFKYRIITYLVTNFHQPQSTLLLLISAFLKGDWRPMYDFALENGFRFLSYGDSSLLKKR